MKDTDLDLACAPSPSADAVGRLDAALAVIDEGVWDWDLRSGQVTHNAHWARLAGLDPKRTTHPRQAYLDRVPEAEREAVVQTLEDCLRGGAPYEIEHRLLLPDGGVIWARERGEVVERDADGHPLRLAGILSDISAPRLYARVMFRRDQLLRVIASVSQMLIGEARPADLMARICQALVRDDLFRMAWIGLLDEDGDRVRPVAEAGFVDGYLARADIRCDASPQGGGPTCVAIGEGRTAINDDTETNPAFAPWREEARRQGYRSSAATPLRRLGRVIGALNVYSGVAHDFGPDEVVLLEQLVTDLGQAMDRQAAEAALREGEARFRLLLDTSPDAILGVDTEGLCTFVNPAALRMLGYARAEELVGRGLHALIHHTHPDGRPYPKEQCHIRLSTLQGKPTHVDSEVHWRKDGSSFPVEYWSHPMYHDGELVGAVVTFTDITERKRTESLLRESEARYREISGVATDVLYSCTRAGDGAFVIDWASGSMEQVFGHSLEELMARGCWRCFVHPDDLPVFDRHVTQLMPGESSECELRILRKDGAVRYLRAYSKVVADEGGSARHRLYGACQDITERVQVREALRESEARFRAMAEQSVDWIWSLDASGRHFYSNDRVHAILGLRLEEFLAMAPAALVHPDDLPLFRQTFRHALDAKQGWRNVTLRWRHRDGSYRVLESSATPLFDDRDELVGFQGVDRDVTERKAAEARIQFLAHHDALTGLPNRVLLRDRFEQAAAYAERDRTHVAMLFLDLDRFKVINDTLGHAAGDRLLQVVVERLRRCVRDSDTVSRQGGDEFILLLNDLHDLAAVERIAGEILARLAEVLEIDGHLLHASCSIGISLYPEDGRDFDTLLQKADAAMYNAKDAGRNTYRFFDAAMNHQAQEHLLLQSRLRQALDGREFRLHYQPQFDIVSGAVVGVEALLRWRNAELGDVSPARFIPVAEDSGLIVPIGAWVLAEACRQAQAWRAAGLPDLGISVNLSALQFRRTNLVETVAAALADSGLPPRLLELELTESILLQDVENTLHTVRQLKALGLRLSIDDFGTGYSSLSYLKRFAVDKLKIDQSFIRDIGTDPDDAAIVRAVIQLARSLRLETIAEGVETEEQLAFIRGEGCREVQGYLFSRPLPAAELEAFLRDRLAARPS
ncbi:MAG: EAL domain-containing protein [Thiobacillaceae bacterium]|jgi:diguanylate cyclase (GGDEF)-like protein/PAS domain S-box-containing protein|nr:EAL domain-containing protein [Thiobacillaceae bacterium]